MHARARVVPQELAARLEHDLAPGAALHLIERPDRLQHRGARVLVERLSPDHDDDVVPVDRVRKRQPLEASAAHAVVLDDDGDGERSDRVLQPVGGLVVAAQHQRKLRVLANPLRLRVVLPHSPAICADSPRVGALGQIRQRGIGRAHHVPLRVEVHVAARMEELPAVGVAGPVVHLPHELELELARRVDVRALKIPVMLLGRSVWQLSGGVPVPLAAVEVGWVGGERLTLAPGNFKPAGMARPVPRRRVRKGVVVRRKSDVEPTRARHKVVPLRHRGWPRTHRDVCADAQTREHDLQLGQDRHGGEARGDHHVRKLAGV